MLATPISPPSLHLSHTPTPRPCLLPNPRALADSTNVSSRLSICSTGNPKGSVFPSSLTRTSCATGWGDYETPVGSTLTPYPSRHHHSSSTTSLFPVTYKAPPTVSISLSAVCSQSIPGQWFRGSRPQGLEPDLPDIRSVVPFPVTPLHGDVDVEMLDGTCARCPDGPLPSIIQAPRKRRSAQSSVSSSQGCFGTEAKQKRPKKSRRQVAELWWLGVVQRSILRSIEVRQSVGKLDASDKLRTGRCDLGVLDRVLVERIRKRLAENGCVDGRALPNPLPRISSPTISLPSLVLLGPSRTTSPVSSVPSALDPTEDSTLDGTTTCSPASGEPPCSPLPVASHLPIPSTSSRRHVHFEISQRPCQAQPRANIPRRSPSPPARMGTSPSHAQMLTLTMPQLIASLTLAHHERCRLRQRGRSHKTMECGNNAGRSPLSVPCRAIQCCDVDAIHDRLRVRQSSTSHTRLLSIPERTSPLSRIAYAES